EREGRRRNRRGVIKAMDQLYPALGHTSKKKPWSPSMGPPRDRLFRTDSPGLRGVLHPQARRGLGQERDLDHIAVLFATPEGFPILANTLQHKQIRISALGAHETGLRDVATAAHPHRLAIAFSIHKIASLV